MASASSPEGVGVDGRQSGMPGTCRMSPTRAVKPSKRKVIAPASASAKRHRSWRSVARRGKKVCANRRNRACATRDQTPLRKVFLASVQPVRMDDDVLSVPAASSAAAAVPASPVKKNARFTDVFFHAHVSGSLRRHPARVSSRHPACSPPPCRRGGHGKKVSRRC